MRAFIAIDLPESVRAALSGAQESFRGISPDARWTRPEVIHLTLKFLGAISDAQVSEVTAALAEAGGFEPFPVDVTGFGFFPNSKRPRVFWAGVTAPHALAELAARIESQMEKLGFAPEGRPYSPHLTLARFKEPHAQPELLAAVSRVSNPSFGNFEVSEFFVFESKLSPHGAQYRKVMRFPTSKQ